MPSLPAQCVSVVIERDWRHVYEFASAPERMPLWAAGLATGLIREESVWRARGPLGDIAISFAPDNDFGVIDHDVTFADGRVFHNPLRVIENGSGALVTFTLFLQPDMTDQQFQDDARAVERDLASLKTILEADTWRAMAPDRTIRIDYIEMTVKDIATAKTFYNNAFGWSFTDYGPDYSEFSDGRMKGGLTTGNRSHPGGPLVILFSDHLEAAERRVVAAGGRIVRQIFAFPGGRRFHFADPDDQELAVWSDR